MKTKRSFFTIPLALGIAVSAASAVQADSTTIEEVVVTAERRESTLQETDISMTVMGAKTLDELGAASLTDIADFVPNIKVSEMPGNWAPQSGYAASGTAKPLRLSIPRWRCISTVS